MIQALVFDFGNVVGYFDHRLTTQRLVSHSALPAAKLHAVINGRGVEEDYETGRLSTSDFLERIRLEGRICCAEEVIVSAYSEIFWPNPEVCALLPELKRTQKLLLGSNTSELHARQFRRQFADVLKHFDAQVLSHEIGVRKPNRGFFEECLRQAGCAPGECVFIDDLESNVAGARACGWHGIVYASLEELQAELAKLGVKLPSAKQRKSRQAADTTQLSTLEDIDELAQER